MNRHIDRLEHELRDTRAIAEDRANERDRLKSELGRRNAQVQSLVEQRDRLKDQLAEYEKRDLNRTRIERGGAVANGLRLAEENERLKNERDRAALSYHAAVNQAAKAEAENERLRAAIAGGMFSLAYDEETHDYVLHFSASYEEAEALKAALEGSE